jgi:ferrous iron transport protein A
MCAMSLIEGKIVEVVSKQPFRGPLTISIGNCKMTIGRGMAHKIFVEEL